MSENRMCVGNTGRYCEILGDMADIMGISNIFPWRLDKSSDFSQ